MRVIWALALLPVFASACAEESTAQPPAEMGPASVASASPTSAPPVLAPASTTTALVTSAAAFITAPEGVMVRSGPGTDWEVIGELSPGREVPVYARSGDWLEIPFGDQVGWVAAALARVSGDLQAVPEVRLTPGATVTIAPAPIGQSAAIESIRTFMGRPDLVVTFVGETTMINSPNADLSVQVYQDELGRQYMVEASLTRVVEIDPTSTLLAVLPDSPVLTVSELRVRALQIVSENTPGFAGMQGRLHYELGTKNGSVYFFRWDDRDSVGWRFNAPFAQVGLYLTGEIASYFNTLILE